MKVQTLPIDRPLDMCRTVVNVTGDAMVSSIVATSEGEKTSWRGFYTPKS